MAAGPVAAVVVLGAAVAVPVVVVLGAAGAYPFGRIGSVISGPPSAYVIRVTA